MPRHKKPLALEIRFRYKNPMRARQLSFFKAPPIEHGGNLNAGKRKECRPFDSKRAVHVVLRSSRARGERSMLRPRFKTKISDDASRIAKKHGLRLFRFTNVGNHLHLLVKAHERRQFQAFLREFAGCVTFLILGSRKGNRILKEGERFWDFIPFTRLVAWGRDFDNLKIYFIKNLFEASGLFTKAMKAARVRPISVTGWSSPPE